MQFAPVSELPMDTASDLKASESKRIEQLSLLLPDTELSEDDYEIENAGATLLHSEIVPLSIELQERIEVIQQAMSVRGTEHYAKVQRQAAKKLGLRDRSLRWLVRAGGLTIL